MDFEYQLPCKLFEGRTHTTIDGRVTADCSFTLYYAQSTIEMVRRTVH